MRAVAVHSFAGGFDLGVKQAGFDIVGKIEGKPGFGLPIVEANRELLGDFPIVELDEKEWPAFQADLVYGNPPCSGFSALSVFQLHKAEDGTRSFVDGRGPGSHLNDSMWELVRYAGVVQPRAVVFESVEAAGRSRSAGGRELMRSLRSELETITGDEWNLTHVFQDCASVGGNAIRKRYFFVATRGFRPGFYPVEVDHVPSVMEAIRGADQARGHELIDRKEVYELTRIADMAIAVGDPWQEGEKVGSVTCRLATGDEKLQKISMATRERYEEIAECFDCADHRVFCEKVGVPFTPPHEKYKQDVSWVRNIHWKSNQYAVRRWRSEEPAFVVTGGFLQDALHPLESRTFTYREAARIMGFPDEWDVQPAIDNRQAGHMWFGKGIPVQAGKWVATGLLRSLEGDPGPITGRTVGDREYEVDVIGHWKEGGAGMRGQQIEMFA